MVMIVVLLILIVIVLILATPNVLFILVKHGCVKKGKTI